MSELFQALHGKGEVTFLVALAGVAALYVWRVVHLTVKVPREKAKLEIQLASATDRREYEKAKAAAEVAEIQSRERCFEAIAESQKATAESTRRLADHYEHSSEQTQALIGCARELVQSGREHARDLKETHAAVGVANEGIKALLEDRRRGALASPSG
jgi:hypothetical protein